MSQYETFGDLKSQLAYKAGHGSLGQAGAETDEEIGRCLNHIQRFLNAKSNNRFLRKKIYFKTLAKVSSDDDAKITTATTALNFPVSGAAVAAWVGADIVIDGGVTPYAIVGVTDADNITIYPSYLGDTVTDAAYVVLSGHLQMPTDFYSALSMTDMTNDLPIGEVSIEKARRMLGNPYVNTVTRPTHYAFEERLYLAADPGSGVEDQPYRLLLVPMPTSAIEIMLDYTKIPTEMDANADIPDIPAEHRSTLVHGAFLMFAEQHLQWEASRLAMTKNLFLEGVKAMSRDSKVAGGVTRFGSFMRPGLRGSIDIEEVDVYALMGMPDV